jgi:hypothetical protein
MGHEDNSDFKNLFPSQPEVWSDPPRRPLTPEEVEAALARLDEEYELLMAAEEASKAEEKKAQKEV